MQASLDEVFTVHCSVLRVQLNTRSPWPVGQVVKTGASHAPIGSSTLPRVTINLIEYMVYNHYIVGVFIDEGPPVPIPNTEVKLICADNT